MHKESELEDQDGWEFYNDETLFPTIPTMTAQAFRKHYKDINGSLEEMKESEKVAFILQMLRNPKLDSFVLELKHSPNISSPLWYSIYSQVQDQHILIPNGWVAKLLQDKFDAYSYTITKQPKAQEIIQTAPPQEDASEWSIFSFLTSLMPVFINEIIQDFDKTLTGDNNNYEKGE